MARCLDDHWESMCLCESEINRALFQDYFVKLHLQRMQGHGLTADEVVSFLDRKKQDHVESWLKWYSDVIPRLSVLHIKPGVRSLGDKSPDFYRSAELVRHLASNYPLIYTVRDPRAIFMSIEAQADATPREKAGRWQDLIGNYQAWKPFLGASNILIVRFEDFVTNPEATMKSVYAHVGLSYSARFLEPFARPFPRRFLWTTAVDWETGIKKAFDPSRILEWKKSLTDDQIRQVQSEPLVVEFMERFGYEIA